MLLEFQKLILTKLNMIIRKVTDLENEMKKKSVRRPQILMMILTLHFQQKLLKKWTD